MADPSRLYAEHPQDVLGQWLDWRRSGPVALVVVTSTEGGSVRAPGALMAVASDGRRCGYISGGCVDADVVAQAQQALEAGKPASLRYGAGSPFIDMPLPCGGAIDIAILPDADEEALQRCHDALLSRRRARLALQELPKSFAYKPKLRIRIAGRGADALALARLVRASGYGLTLQLRDGEDISEAELNGFPDATALKTPTDLPPLTDDEWTAFVLMFHDPDWEAALLKQALSGSAFYIGAVGSRQTQLRRRNRLAQEGIAPEQIDRIHGPVGLVPSVRDASMLAVSALAEITGAYKAAQAEPFSDTAVLLLAAGESQRYADGDKLHADLGGRPVLSHAAGLLMDYDVAARVAVVGADQPSRRILLESEGWQIVVNRNNSAGQSTSLKVGIQAISGLRDVKHVLVLLADMPFVSETHLLSLRGAIAPDISAAMSISSDTLCPPAIFSRAVFDQLANISGDTGARHVFRALEHTATIPLTESEAIDIDTTEDLARATSAVTV